MWWARGRDNEIIKLPLVRVFNKKLAKMSNLLNFYFAWESWEVNGKPKVVNECPRDATGISFYRFRTPSVLLILVHWISPATQSECMSTSVPQRNLFLYKAKNAENQFRCQRNKKENDVKQKRGINRNCVTFESLLRPKEGENKKLLTISNWSFKGFQRNL